MASFNSVKRKKGSCFKYLRTPIKHNNVMNCFMRKMAFYRTPRRQDYKKTKSMKKRSNKKQKEALKFMESHTSVRK